MATTIVMTTYMPDEKRLDCAKSTIDGLARYLRSQDHLFFHIADDGSNMKYSDDLLNYARTAGRFKNITRSIAERKGIGGSLNLALSAINTDRWMYITDDWKLKKTLDLDIPILLTFNHGYDYVRLGPIHPNLECEVRYYEDTEYFLDLHNWTGGFHFATRPFLATKNFYEMMGPFDEGLDAYDTERNYSDKCNAATLSMAFVGDLDPRSTWEHIGDISPVGHIKPGSEVKL